MNINDKVNAQLKIRLKEISDSVLLKSKDALVEKFKSMNKNPEDSQAYGKVMLEIRSRGLA